MEREEMVANLAEALRLIATVAAAGGIDPLDIEAALDRAALCVVGDDPAVTPVARLLVHVAGQVADRSGGGADEERLKAYSVLAMTLAHETDGDLPLGDAMDVCDAYEEGGAPSAAIDGAVDLLIPAFDAAVDRASAEGGSEAGAALRHQANATAIASAMLRAVSEGPGAAGGGPDGEPGTAPALMMADKTRAMAMLLRNAACVVMRPFDQPQD